MSLHKAVCSGLIACAVAGCNGPIASARHDLITVEQGDVVRTCRNDVDAYQMWLASTSGAGTMESKSSATLPVVPHSITLHNAAHDKINIFTIPGPKKNRNASDVHAIYVLLGEGVPTHSGASRPTITDICLDDPLDPQPTNTGNIEFKTQKGHVVLIEFNLNHDLIQDNFTWKIASGTGEKPSDSIYLGICPQLSTGDCAKGYPPSRDDWPTCADMGGPAGKASSVHVNGPKMYFNLCSRATDQETNSYYYVLHLDRVEGSVRTDAPIDPQIINRPG